MNNDVIQIEYPETGTMSEYCYMNKDLIAEIVKVDEIIKLPTTWREVYHVKLNKILCDILPVDAIGIFPPNDKEKIDKLFNICGWNDNFIYINRTSANPIKYVGTLKDLFIRYIDLSTMPKKLFIKAMAKYSNHKSSYFEFLGSKEGTKEYLKLASDWTNVFDLIRELNCRIPLEEFLKYCDLTVPRYYSLINLNCKPCEFILGILENKDKSKFGLLSGHIKHCSPEYLTICYRRKSLLKPVIAEFKSEVPLIVFCIGTGIAPVISLLRNTHCYKCITIIYGFRNEEDNLLNYLVKGKDLYNTKVKLVLCKSTDKNYVTDNCNINILERYNDQLINVFVCGNIKMQKEIFIKIRNKYNHLIENSRIYFDNWR